jgi:hypothetical protein
MSDQSYAEANVRLTTLRARKILDITEDLMDYIVRYRS